MQQVKELKKKYPGSKNGNRSNKEIPKGETLEDRKPRKEIRNHRCITKRMKEIKERLSQVEDAK